MRKAHMRVDSTHDTVTPDDAGRHKGHLWFFRSQACPHCRDAKVAVERSDADYPWVVQHSNEVTLSSASTRRYVDMARPLSSAAPKIDFLLRWSLDSSGLGPFPSPYSRVGSGIVFFVPDSLIRIDDTRQDIRKMSRYPFEIPYIKRQDHRTARDERLILFQDQILDDIVT